MKDLKHRPFFTIVIPCHNSRKTIGNLLQSILKQDMPDDLEIILSDDQSTETYDDIVEPYYEKLVIKRISTDYNFAPGNTREKGVSIATGEWLCFADHDDEFEPGSLKLVKESIIKYDQKYMIITNFRECDPVTNKVIKCHTKTLNWMHAKFYNRDNLWIPFNIHFEKDLLTHEDICVSCKISCALSMLGEKAPLFLDVYTYRWNNRPTTISRKTYPDGYCFLETFYEDYLKSTLNVYISKYLEGAINKDFAFIQSCSSLLYGYFYIQGFKYEAKMINRPYKKENLIIFQKYLVKVKQCFSVTNNDILNAFAGKPTYFNIRDNSYTAVSRFIETDSFYHFMQDLHEDIKPLITMKDAMYKGGDTNVGNI